MQTSLKLPLLKERRTLLKLLVFINTCMAWRSCLLILLLRSLTQVGTHVVTIFICITRLHTQTVICILVFPIPYHCGIIFPCLCIIVFLFPLLNLVLRTVFEYFIMGSFLLFVHLCVRTHVNLYKKKIVMLSCGFILQSDWYRQIQVSEINKTTTTTTKPRRRKRKE